MAKKYRRDDIFVGSKGGDWTTERWKNHVKNWHRNPVPDKRNVLFKGVRMSGKQYNAMMEDMRQTGYTSGEDFEDAASKYTEAQSRWTKRVKKGRVTSPQVLNGVTVSADEYNEIMRKIHKYGVKRGRDVMDFDRFVDKMLKPIRARRAKAQQKGRAAPPSGTPSGDKEVSYSTSGRRSSDARPGVSTPRPEGTESGAGRYSPLGTEFTVGGETHRVKQVDRPHLTGAVNRAQVRVNRERMRRRDETMGGGRHHQILGTRTPDRQKKYDDTTKRYVDLYTGNLEHGDISEFDLTSKNPPSGFMSDRLKELDESVERHRFSGPKGTLELNRRRSDHNKRRNYVWDQIRLENQRQSEAQELEQARTENVAAINRITGRGRPAEGGGLSAQGRPTPTTTGQQKPVERQGATITQGRRETSRRASDGLAASPVSVSRPLTGEQAEEDLADMLFDEEQFIGDLEEGSLSRMSADAERKRWGVPKENRLELKLLEGTKNPLPLPRMARLGQAATPAGAARVKAYSEQQEMVRQYVELKVSRDEKIHPHVLQNYPENVQSAVHEFFGVGQGARGPFTPLGFPQTFTRPRHVPNRKLQYGDYTKDLQEAERDLTRPGWEKFGVYTKGMLQSPPRAISPATGKATVPPPYPMGTLPSAPGYTGLPQPSMSDIYPPSGEGVPRFMQQPNPHGDIRARSTQTPSPLPTGAPPPQRPSSPSVMGFQQPSMSDISPTGGGTPQFMQPPSPYGDIRGLTDEQRRLLMMMGY
jgi:hypothetical protein